MLKEEVEEMGRCYAAGFKDGIRPQAKNAVASGRWKRHRNGFSPGASRRNQPCSHLYFKVARPMSDDTQNCKNKFCFEATICSDGLHLQGTKMETKARNAKGTT